MLLFLLDWLAQKQRNILCPLMKNFHKWILVKTVLICSICWFLYRIVQKIWSSTSFFPVFGNWEGTHFNKKVNYKHQHVRLWVCHTNKGTCWLMTWNFRTTPLSWPHCLFDAAIKNLENQPISQTWFRGPVQRLFSRDAQQIACRSRLWP